MPEKNVQLLKDTLDWIKANPKLHDQGDWVQIDEDSLEACETPMCFAGHAALLAGGQFDKDKFAYDWDWNLDLETGEHVYVDDDNENMVHVSTYASHKLGLNDTESSYLFYGGRSAQEIENAVNAFCDGYTVDFDDKFYKEEN